MSAGQKCLRQVHATIYLGIFLAGAIAKNSQLPRQILRIIFGICTRCQQIDFLKQGKLEGQKDIHFKTQPGQVAKNATPRPPAGD